MALGDAAAVAVPLLVLQPAVPTLAAHGLPDWQTVVAAAIWIVTAHVYGLYPRYPRYVTTTTLNELPQIFHATVIAAVTTWAWFKLYGADNLGASLGVMILAGTVAVPAVRMGVRRGLHHVVGAERVLLVGSGSTTSVIARSLQGARDVFVVGHRPVPAAWRTEQPAGSDDAADRSLRQIVTEEHVDRVLLSTRDLRHSAVGDVLQWSREANVTMTVVPEHFDVVGAGATIDHVQGATVISLQPPVLSRTSRGLKRGLDLAGAFLGLAVMAPLMLAIAIAIRIDSKGPVLFVQDRIGRRGARFRLLKFRTMVPHADAMVDELMAASSDPNWLQITSDPRVTRVGRVLRSTSLDELPQLWNVLVGHMSLVGPRPLSERDDARVNGWARGRLDLTPGLTGLWQVLGRKSVPFEEMVKIDYVYVNNWSLWGDVKLLLQTLPAVISQEGAR
ncbi:MAG: sugar transferase [Patulibacter sp.]